MSFKYPVSSEIEYPQYTGGGWCSFSRSQRQLKNIFFLMRGCRNILGDAQNVSVKLTLQLGSAMLIYPCTRCFYVFFFKVNQHENFGKFLIFVFFSGECSIKHLVHQDIELDKGRGLNKQHFFFM